MQENFYVRHLPKTIMLMGLGFIGLFGTALLLMAFGLTEVLLRSEFGTLLLRLVRWGGVSSHAEHYEAMICVIYVVWGWYLFKVAPQPEKNIAFLDFTVAANIAHFGLMTMMAFVMPNEKLHLLGDILLGGSLLILFMWFWIPSRRIILMK